MASSHRPPRLDANPDGSHRCRSRLLPPCHRRWRFISAAGFLLLAVLGSVTVTYATIGRQADVADAKVGDAMRRNRLLEMKLAELATAKANAKVECKVLGDRCKSWNDRVDRLTNETGSLSVVSTDARQDAIVRLAVLLGATEAKVRAIDGAFSPLLLPLMLELGSVIFFASAFPRRRLQRAIVVQSLTQSTAMSQLELARAWGVHPSTVSRRLRRLEAAGHLRRQREGKCKQVALRPGKCLAVPR
jgi:hypothetical protein